MEKSAVIICNGQFPKTEYPRYIIRTADIIVCTDGAAGKFLRNSRSIFSETRLPDAVVGDMDSISPSTRRRLADRFIRVPDQETNDQTKAFKYVLENYPEVRRITIIGAGGEREDHTIGNLALLMEYAREFNLEEMGIYVSAVSDYSTAFAITDTCEFDCGEGRRVSIFSPDNSLKIRSEGLMYKTDDVVFDNWWKATLNVACADRVKLTLSHRSIALIITD